MTDHALPSRPEDVPAQVDDAMLRALLSRGRPAASVGDGERAVVFVHGLGHDAWDFGAIVDTAQAEHTPHTLHTFDMPGFGPQLLDSAPTPIALRDLVTALLNVVKALPRPPVVVASSLGGHVALMAALDEPDAFAGLSLLAPGGLVQAPAPTAAVLRGYYSEAAIKARPDEEIVRNSRRIFVQPVAASDHLAVRKLAWHRASADNKQRFAVPFASVVDSVLDHYIGDVVHRVKLPMQVVFGEGDIVVPLSAGRLLERACGASLHLMRGVGHTPHLEDPHATWRIVGGFADSLLR